MGDPQVDPNVDINECCQAQAQSWGEQIAEIVKRSGGVPEGSAKGIILSMGDDCFYFIHCGDMYFNPNLLQIPQNLIV